MPSRSRSLPNGHPRSPRKLPWFLDALLWMRPLLSPHDRSILDLVRLDLADELDALLTEGMSRRAACREVRLRVRLESRFFAPRALEWQRTRLRQVLRAPHPRMLARTAAVVAVCGVGLLSAKWLVFDPAFRREAGELARRLHETLEQVNQTSSAIQRLASTTHATQPVSQEALSVLNRYLQLKEYLRGTDHDHPGQFELQGWMGQIDEDVARFWAHYGDDQLAERHWCSALSYYLDGAANSDRVAMFQLGAWYLAHNCVDRAVPLLRSAYQHWPGILLPGSDSTGHVAVRFHEALIDLWRQTHDPGVLAEASEIEAATTSRLQQGLTKEFDYLILCNAAYLRIILIGEGHLSPIEGLGVSDLLLHGIEIAGADAPIVASWITTEDAFATLRPLPFFAPVLNRATELLREQERTK